MENFGRKISRPVRLRMDFMDPVDIKIITIFIMQLGSSGATSAMEEK